MPDLENTQFDLQYRKSKPLITFFYLFSHDKKLVIIANILAIIKHTPAMVLPVIIGNVINIIIHPGPDSFRAILINSAVMAILLLQNIPNHTFFVRFLSKAIRNVEARLRSALIKRMQELSISFHDSFESGRLQTKVLRDVESIEILSRQMVNVLMTGILNILFAMVVTLMSSFIVAMFYLATVPLSVFLVKIFRERMESRNKDFRNELEQMSAKVNEMVQMIPITRAHGIEDVEIQRMDRQLENVKQKAISLDTLNALFGSSAWVTFQGFQFLCLLVTGYLAWIHKIQVGDVVMYNGFFAMIVNSVNMIITILPEITRGLESIKSLGEILECPDIELNEGKKKVASVHGNFKFENVNFTYNNENYQVQDFNLDVKPGECIAFVGESGAGKSTILNLLIGHRRVSNGKILLDAINMDELDLRTYRKFLAVVPQNTILFSGSIRENITYGLEDVPEEFFQEVIKMAHLDEVIDKLPFGLETKIGESGSKLSGGQRQRIAIARALIRNPKVIIFDEATSALDVESEKYIQKAISEMIKGRTTFMVAHRLSTIRHADRIVVMKEGKILEIGSHEELLDLKGQYFKMNEMG